MKILILPLAALLCAACGGRNSPNTSTAQTESVRTTVAHDAVATRDSVRWNALTPHQRTVYEKLETVLLERLRVEDNRVSLAMSEADFRAAGLPDSLHVQLMRDLEAMNRFADSTKANMNELIAGYKHSIRSLHE